MKSILYTFCYSSFFPVEFIVIGRGVPASAAQRGAALWRGIAPIQFKFFNLNCFVKSAKVY